MEFGLFYQLPCGPDQSAVDRYDDMIAEAQVADRLGFDSIWLAELHFNSRFSVMPAPLLAAAAIAVAASTEYKVVAQTSDGLFLFQACRIRQAATGLLERLPSDATIKPVGGTVLAADWEVAGSVYTVPRSSERAISRISGRV